MLSDRFRLTAIFFDSFSFCSKSLLCVANGLVFILFVSVKMFYQVCAIWDARKIIHSFLFKNVLSKFHSLKMLRFFRIWIEYEGGARFMWNWLMWYWTLSFLKFMPICDLWTIHFWIWILKVEKSAIIPWRSRKRIFLFFYFSTHFSFVKFFNWSHENDITKINFQIHFQLRFDLYFKNSDDFLVEVSVKKKDLKHNFVSLIGFWRIDYFCFILFIINNVLNKIKTLNEIFTFHKIWLIQ